jgi:predicted nucleotidyltransferase
MIKLNMTKYQKKLNKVPEENKVILAYLFGSEAKGLAHKESDVDIGVFFAKEVSPKDYLKKEGKLIEFFAEIFPKKEINIVNLNIASPLLKQVVILEGKPLFIRSDSDRILFEVQTLHEYEEYLYLNNIYNQFLDLKLKTI